MKIAYASSPGIDHINGGLRQQVNHTMNAVQSAGFEVFRIRTAEELEQSSTDLLHVFSVGYDTIDFIRASSQLSIPLVLSPVIYTNHSLTKLKWGLKTEKLLSVFSGRSSNEMIVKEEGCLLSDHLLPNTSQEANLLHVVFGISRDRITVIPNGVELRFENGDPELFESRFGVKNFILFAGQSSAQRKNVISLLRLSKTINRQIVILGDFDDSEYSIMCQKLASEADNVILIPTLEHDSDLLRSAYTAAEVFVLPSWFETPGIAAMEAALAGCKIVITSKGGTRDYFGEYAEYVDPHSDKDILRGIKDSLSADFDPGLRDHIRENYSWAGAAAMTLKAYQNLLSKSGQL